MFREAMKSSEQQYKTALEQQAAIRKLISDIQLKGVTTPMSAQQELALLTQINECQSKLDVINLFITNLLKAHPELVLATLPQGAITGDHHVSNPSASTPSAFFYPGPLGTFHPGINANESKHQSSHKRRAPGNRNE
ncbi:MAG: hypothetical protein V4501_05690 [Pseudomonadota bacterium]